MNNSKLAIESVNLQVEEVTGNDDFFREREQTLITVIGALQTVRKTTGWSSLKQELFDKLPADLEKQITQEAKKENPNIQKLNRLSGELKWAERYADLQKLEDTFKVELSQIRLKLYGKT